MTELDLAADIVDLTAALVDVPSQSHNERQLADAVESALLALPHLKVTRLGDNVIARTELNRDQRVVIAGHLDTVPAADNLPSRLVDDRLYGLGACDMKGGVAVALALAAGAIDPVHDVTFAFYSGEEVEDSHNGLGHVLAKRPELLAADFAILMEPSDAGVEAGCQGTLRAVIATQGRRAHSARSWVGDNAIHHAAEILHRLNSYEPRREVVDGLEYREGLSAVGISGGVAGNVIPDECTVTVNYRYAPTRSADEAAAHVREVFSGFDLDIVDNSPGAMPGLDRPAAVSFLAAVGGQARPKFGWTDVSRFSAIGVPSVNYGPGDPVLAHTRDEFVPVAHLRSTLGALRSWLGLVSS